MIDLFHCIHCGKSTTDNEWDEKLFLWCNQACFDADKIHGAPTYEYLKNAPDEQPELEIVPLKEIEKIEIKPGYLACGRHKYDCLKHRLNCIKDMKEII